MPMIFHLITEGPTDQVVLRYLLAGYFSDPDIDIRALQPNIDSTDKADHFGGWRRVIEYCSSADMEIALQTEGMVIIQIDTDVCEQYGVPKREEGRKLIDHEIISKTKSVIIGKIGKELYGQYHQKIIFAISYESIECWLLPLYYSDNNRNKTVNCCEKLNQELKKGPFTLDRNNKQKKYYEKICREKRDKIKNKKEIESISEHNDSFKRFILQLAAVES
jgi:hypothetical protein